MNEFISVANLLLNILVVPLLIILNGIRKEAAKTNANLDKHIAVTNILFEAYGKRLDILEKK